MPETARADTGYVERVEAFAAAWPTTSDMIISLRPLEPAGPRISLLHSDLLTFAADRRALAEKLAAASSPARVWLYEKDGAEPEPWASLDDAQADAVQGWPKGSLLAWRHSPDGSMRLHVNGVWTRRVIAPATVRTGPADDAGDANAGEPAIGVVRSCRTCGCTQDDACEGGCAWVTDGTLEIDLCTACAWAIARDAIASGLYHLEPTAGDSVFEARGGLIPQPILTEAEIEGLQPLIEAVEAARGDQEKIDAIAAEHGLIQGRFDESASVGPALHLWQPTSADLGRAFAKADPRTVSQAVRAMHDFAASLAQLTDTEASPVWLSPATVTVYRQPPEIEAAAAQLHTFLDAWPSDYGDTILNIAALAPPGSPIPLRHSALRIVLDALVVSHLEWRVRGGGFVGPETSEAEARRYVTDQRRLFSNEGPGQHGIVQCRQVGPWVDAQAQP
jgi:hypothetical protein